LEEEECTGAGGFGSNGWGIVVRLGNGLLEWKGAVLGVGEYSMYEILQVWIGEK